MSGSSVVAYGTHEELLRTHASIAVGGPRTWMPRPGRRAMTELQTVLPGSARPGATPPRRPGCRDSLRPPQSGSPRVRLRAWRQRHLPGAPGAGVFASASSPERGLPVADRTPCAVLRGPVQTRKGPSRADPASRAGRGRGLTVPGFGYLVDEVPARTVATATVKRAGWRWPRSW